MIRTDTTAPAEINVSTDPNLFQLAIERFDALNAQDPNIDVADGVSRPKELLYAQRMTECLDRFAPDASEPLRLAARCQHILRWHSPRSNYPMDRAGYHRWRTDLATFHAETAGRVLHETGYDDATIARVQSLVRKDRLKADPDAQTLEDVICLVFLQYYFADFSEQHDEAKLIGILKRTWAKMSPRGRDAAMALDLPREKRLLIEKALAPSPPGRGLG